MFVCAKYLQRLFKIDRFCLLTACSTHFENMGLLYVGVGILALLDFLALAGWAFIGMIRKANQFTSALLEQEENEVPCMFLSRGRRISSRLGVLFDGLGCRWSLSTNCLLDDNDVDAETSRTTRLSYIKCLRQCLWNYDNLQVFCIHVDAFVYRFMGLQGFSVECENVGL